MSQTFGYLIDLADYKFDESSGPTWIHGMPAKNYSHPLYGDIKIDNARVKRFADSVNTGVRGQDLDIDYDHKDKENVAAGWIKAAEARNDGLWLLVDWTPRARKHLAEKEYRYFSPEFQDEWTHPATKQKHTDVLFGGGLTNRPYLKGITPINLSEFFTDPEGSKSMTPEQKKALATKYGLGEDATDDQVLAAATNATLAPPAVVDTPAQLSELQAQIDELKTLSEKNPAIAPMIKLMEAQQTEMKALSEKVALGETALRLTEMAGLVKKLDEKANASGFGIPKPVIEAAKTFLSENSLTKKFSEDFYGVIEGILDAKLVQLGEVRRGGKGPLNDDDPIKKFTDLANKMVKDESISFAEATEKVAKENEELWTAYREASYSNPGGV